MYNSTETLYKKRLNEGIQLFFGDLSQAECSFFTEDFEYITLKGGSYLFKQGDKADGIYFVLSGKLQVLLENENETKIIAELGKLEPIGEFAVLTNEPRTASVKAVRSAHLAKLSIVTCLKLMHENPNFLFKFSQIIIKRLLNRQIKKRNIADNFVLFPIHESLDINNFTDNLEQAFSHKKVLFIDKNMKLPSNDIEFSHWLEVQEVENDHIIFVASRTDKHWNLRCFQEADEVLIVADASHNPQVSILENEFLISDFDNLQQRLILLHPSETEIPSQTIAWLESRPKVHFHHHIRLGNQSHVERLMRYLTNSTNAFVCAGGGAKGMAHIGVYTALKEHNIPIDLVGGTSIGSIAAAAIALDLTTAATFDVMARNFINNPTKSKNLLPIFSISNGNLAKEIFEKEVNDTCLEDTWIPIYVVASNLSTAEEEVFFRGKIVDTLMASTALPGLYSPYVYKQQLYVDGGVFNNFPVDVAYNHGAAYIIGCNLSDGALGKVSYDDFPSVSQFYYKKWFKGEVIENVPSILSNIANSAVLGSIKKGNDYKQFVNLYIQPNLKKYGLLDFKAYKAIYEAGYEAANFQIKTINN